MTVPESEMKISGVCDDIKELLINKNRKYGNSALKPCRVFSKASAVEQLLVRIDDKLNRIMQGAGLLANDEDVVNDLIGYLILHLLHIKYDSSFLRSPLHLIHTMKSRISSFSINFLH